MLEQKFIEVASIDIPTWPSYSDKVFSIQEKPVTINLINILAGEAFMSKPKLLIVWSNYHKELAQQQLESCLALVKPSPYRYDVETVQAGSYEIPAVIQYYHHHSPYDGYISLGLLLKGATDHYEFIWEHLKDCFIKFALEGIIVGNGIISAPNMDLLLSRLHSGERSLEAYNAVDYLMRLKSRSVIG